jgi:protein gp37
MAVLFAAGELEPLPHVWIGTSVEDDAARPRISALVSIRSMTRFVSFEPLIGPIGPMDLEGVHWAIVGGESGPNARPMNIEWVDEIKAACRRAGTAFFFKQWGGRNKKTTGRVFRGRTYSEYPRELSV